MVFYAVAKGYKAGVYETWVEAYAQVHGFKNAKYKKFNTYSEAEKYISGCKEEILDIGNDLIVFTDGAARNNHNVNIPTLASFAIVWPYHEEYNYCSKLYDGGTNNIAELNAILHALTICDIIDPSKIRKLIIYTDSQYSINCFTLWIHKWRDNNWKKSNNDSIQNIDLIRRIDELLSLRPVIFKHVRAHTGAQTWEAIYNDKVDKLANSVLES